MMSFMQMPVKAAAPYMVIKNNDDLDRMIEICRDLSTQYEYGDELVGTLIEKYEDEHIRFNANPESMMRYLMEKHGHKQTDMTDVAPRPVINTILNGKRKLTRTHIERLIKKYNITGDWFYS